MIGDVINGRYLLESKIGQGAYGTVYKVKDKKNNNQFFALKQVLKSKIESDTNNYLKQALDKELKIMYLMSHENSVKLLEDFETKDCYNLIMELCDSDLDIVLKEHIRKANKAFNELELYLIMTQFNKIFKKMQDEHVIHRDLKLKNIMVKFDKKVPIIGFLIKLSDFGFSKFMAENELTTTQLGTPATGAPEIMIGEEYNSKADLWSVGVIIFQLLYNALPFPGRTRAELKRAILQSKGVKLPDNNKNPISETCFDLINRLLKKNPDERIEFEDYFKHKFFSKSHLKELMEKMNIKENLPISVNIDNSEKNEETKNKEIDIKIFEINDFDRRFQKLIKIKDLNGYKLYKAKDKQNDKYAYIKEITLDDKDKNKDKNVKIVNREIELLAILKGKNFPEFIGYSQKDSNYNIAIEYFYGNILEDFIQRTQKKLSESLLESIYTQLKPAFLELKEKNIEFDAISSNNFAFSFYQSENNCEIKFFDYGINMIFFEEKSQMFKKEDFLNFDVEKQSTYHYLKKKEPIIKDEYFENIFKKIKNKINFVIKYFNGLTDENIFDNELYFNDIIIFLYLCALECKTIIQFLEINANMDVLKLDKKNQEIHLLTINSNTSCDNVYDYSYINFVKEDQYNDYLYNKENPSFSFFLNIFKDLYKKLDDIFKKILSNSKLSQHNNEEEKNDEFISIYEDETTILDNSFSKNIIKECFKDGNLNKFFLNRFENGNIFLSIGDKGKAINELKISVYLYEYVILLKTILRKINTSKEFAQICGNDYNKDFSIISFIGRKIKYLQKKGVLGNLNDNELKDEDFDKIIMFYSKIVKLINAIKPKIKN